MLTVDETVLINKRFDTGNLVNRNSLEFALSSAKNTKDWVTQLAYIMRAILIDHVFAEGNKRTVLAVMIAFVEFHKKGYELYKLDQIIVRMLKDNITDIAKIRRLIKDGVW